MGGGKTPKPSLDGLSTSSRSATLSAVDQVGEFWSYPQSRTFAEPPIDCEEDRTLRAVLVGMLRGG